MNITSDDFRKTIGLFPTGVAVVTTRCVLEDRDVGLTISSLTSVSLSPPQVLFCLSKKSSSAPIFQASQHFMINILSQDQSHLSNYFARSSEVDWSQIATQRHEKSTCLLLTGATGHLVCEKAKIYDGDDHEIILGKVIDVLQSEPTSPLVRHTGQYWTTAPFIPTTN